MLDPELQYSDETLDIIFGARAFAYALRKLFTTATPHCMIWSELKN